MSGMVEKRGISYWLTHVGLSSGVLVLFFPLWLAFVASTVTNEEVIHPPMPLWPGDQFLENYSRALIEGDSGQTSASVARMLFNTTIVATCIAVCKIAISFTSAFAIDFFRFVIAALESL